MVHRVRLVHAVPLTASHTDVRGNGIADWASDADTVPPCRWVTDVHGRTRTVEHLLRGGRARWKIAPATVTTLHNQGDTVAHHAGPGAQPLSVVCAVLLLLAFVVDQTQQRCGAVCQAVWAQLGSTCLLWERRSAVFSDEAVASRRQGCAALLSGCKQSRPLRALEASSSPSLASATACQRTSHPVTAPSGGERCLQHERSLLSPRPPGMSHLASAAKDGHGWSKPAPSCPLPSP